MEAERKAGRGRQVEGGREGKGRVKDEMKGNGERREMKAERENKE